MISLFLIHFHEILQMNYYVFLRLFLLFLLFLLLVVFGSDIILTFYVYLWIFSFILRLFLLISFLQVLSLLLIYHYNSDFFIVLQSYAFLLQFQLRLDSLYIKILMFLEVQILTSKYILSFYYISGLSLYYQQFSCLSCSFP